MPDMIRKLMVCEVKKLEDRVLEFVGSTEEQDRDGEIIKADGWDLKNFKKNPIVMWAHRYDQPPIGKANKVHVKEGKLLFDVEFAPAETYEFADTIYKLYMGGFIKATSVGFVPKEWEDGDGIKSPKRIYNKQELLELSCVPVPSNANALIQARDSGLITIKAFEEITKPETTENYHRVPVPGEAGKHDGHRIRTITISEEKGIKAIYCGQCKVVMTYLFDTEKWSIAEAEAWVREHSPDKSGLLEISQSAIGDELDYVKSLIDKGRLNEENLELARSLAYQILRIPGSDIPVAILEKFNPVKYVPEKMDAGIELLNLVKEIYRR